MPPEFSAIYPQYYRQIDPWINAGLKILRPMQSARSSELCSPSELERQDRDRKNPYPRLRAMAVICCSRADTRRDQGGQDNARFFATFNRVTVEGAS
jgi:hypothetical protein